MMKHLTSALKDRLFLCDFGCCSYLSWFFFSFYLYKNEKKEQNDDELLFWSLLFIWGTSGEVLEKCFFYI
ncbi:Uncharacterised protein [Vibrio owensii]|nr:Uncharacterised protein [Vibrio owensii]